MMYVLVGGATLKKIPQALEELQWENVSIEEILSLATTASLLGDTQAFKLTGALGSARGEEFLDSAQALTESPHTFVFVEEKLLKKPTDSLTKTGAEIIAVKKEPTKEKESFNVFALTYALAARDKKKLWLLFTEAMREGVVPEAMAGIMHWKVRDLYSKHSFKGSGGVYTEGELRHLSSMLVSLYHDSHRGAGDLGLLLEQFILLL
jgi:DNA polymerase III delta subunit